MPEHIHLLTGEPSKGDPSKVLQVLKQKVSRALRATRRKPLHPQLSLPFHEGEARGHPY
jgi:REP element-mobilizing transposase RayT